MSDLISSKIPPSNVEAERIILSAILLDNNCIDKVLDLRLSPEDFYDNKNGNIFRTILQIQKNNIKNIDLISLTEFSRSINLLDKIGGVDYLNSLIDITPSSANIEYYAELIKNKSMLRQLIYISQEIIHKGYASPIDVKAFIDESERKIFDINQEIHTSGFSHIGDIIYMTINQLSKEVRNPGEYSGISSGFIDLDTLTDGFQKQEFIVIAARPGMGKTALALNIAINSATKSKNKIGFFSGEMSKRSLGERILASESRISSEQFRRGINSKYIADKIVNAGAHLYKDEIGLYIDDTPNIPILELRSKARRMKKDLNINMIIVDYLQLITVGNELSKNTPRHEEIAYISRSLKGLARDLDIPVIALAQLNRNLSNRGEEAVPRLSDLKDSGSIEQDADLVIFIHHPEKKGDKKDGEEEENLDFKKVELIIGKNRNGPTDTVNLLFFPKFTKFENASKYQVD